MYDFYITCNITCYITCNMFYYKLFKRVLKLIKHKTNNLEFSLKKIVLFFFVLIFLIFESTSIFFSNRYVFPFIIVISSYILILLDSIKLKYLNNEPKNKRDKLISFSKE